MRGGELVLTKLNTNPREGVGHTLMDREEAVKAGLIEP
jgi:hypothetical protein